MKNIISKNIGLKLLSVLLALILWLTVMNVEDPTVTQTITDIPVQIINDEVIKSRGYGYTVESGEKIDIRVKGRRSVVTNISAEDFTAVADFNAVSSMKMVPIEVKCTDDHAGELVWTVRTESMAISLEAEQNASKSIRIDRIGEVKEGYYLYEYTTNTSLVSVFGAESQVAKVKEVVAEVNIEGIKDSGDIEVALYAVDQEGEKIDSKKVTLVPEEITVHLTVNPIKTVPLTITTTGNPGQYRYLGDIEFAPSEINVTGDEAVLKDIESFEIVVDVSNAYADIEKQINIEEYIEEKYPSLNLKLVDQTKTMGVRIPVILMSEKTLEIHPSDIRLVGANYEKYKYTISMGAVSRMVVRGKEEDLTNIEISDFDLYIDALGLDTPSTYSVPIQSGYTGSLTIQMGTVELIIEENVSQSSEQETGEDDDLTTMDE